MKRLILIGIFILAACSSTTAPVQYYQLPDSAFELPPNMSNLISIRVVLSEPLKSNSLLYQSDEHHLNFAQKNLWSAPLEEALATNLANKLNRLRLGTYQPQKWADNSKVSVLTVYLDRFQGTYRGETEISGYARWQDGRSRAFHIQTPQYGDGYTAMLDSLNQGLVSVAQEIVR